MSSGKGNGTPLNKEDRFYRLISTHVMCEGLSVKHKLDPLICNGGGGGNIELSESFQSELT